jgi:GNAT superfamily N-acetyltransferase
VTVSVGTRERLWSLDRERLLLNAVRAPHRVAAEFGTVVGINLGVPHAWGVQISAGARVPDDRDAVAAMAWADLQAPAAWRANVPISLLGQGAWADLDEREHIDLFATSGTRAASLPTPDVPRLVITKTPSYDQVIAGYGGWMNDRELARLLVTPDDLFAAGRTFLVGLVDGQPIGCALVWTIEDTGYLSGIGVVEAHRGRGYGLGLTTAAAQIASVLRDGRPASLVWMHATADGAALYARMGFDLIDTEVQLGPPALAL